jgi:hypothetical protein
VNPLQVLLVMWRHKLAVLPVIALTAFGLVYVTALTPPTYELAVSYVLVPPPGPPSAEERAQDPVLGRADPDNPFTRFGTTSVLVDLVARDTDRDSNREALAAAGADDRWQVVPSSRYGFSSPIVDIIAIGDSQESAKVTARLVSESVERSLHDLQAAQRVDETYMYKPLLIDFPTEARLRFSNKLRAVIAMLAVGGLLTFATTSVAEALAQRPRRKGKATPVHLAPLGNTPIRGTTDGDRAAEASAPRSRSRTSRADAAGAGQPVEAHGPSPHPARGASTEPRERSGLRR